MTAGHRIELRGLTKRFQGRPALDAASFVLEGPRAVGYLGPNGAGKTTTLKLLAGLLRPDSGTASIDGIDVQADPRGVRLRTGTLIEMPEPYGTLTVREALEMVGEFRGIAPGALRPEVRHWAEALDLPPLDRRCGKLSKGQRQRVALASSLIGDPPVLLLDEPTTGLDPAERVRVRNVLLDLRRDHLVFMSSHLLGEVRETCDDVIFLNEGRVLLQQSVAALVANFRVQQVEVEFDRVVPREALGDLGGLAASMAPAGERRWRIGFDGRDATRVQLLERVQAVAPVLSFVPVGSALEDSYLRLVAGEPGALAPPPST